MPKFSPVIQHDGPICFRFDPQDRLELAMKIEVKQVNPLKVSLGGMMMTFMDSLIRGPICYETSPEKTAPTLPLTCDFIRSAMLGESVIAWAQVNHSPNTLAFATCNVHPTSLPDVVTVTANGIYSLPKKEATCFNTPPAMRHAHARTAAKVSSFASNHITS